MTGGDSRTNAARSTTEATVVTRRKHQARRLPAICANEAPANWARNGGEQGKRCGRDAHGNARALLEPNVDKHRSRQIHEERGGHAEHNAVQIHCHNSVAKADATEAKPKTADTAVIIQRGSYFSSNLPAERVRKSPKR